MRNCRAGTGIEALHGLLTCADELSAPTALAALVTAFTAILTAALVALVVLDLAAEAVGLPPQVVRIALLAMIALVSALLLVEVRLFIGGYRPRAGIAGRVEVGNVAGDHTGCVRELLRHLGVFADAHALTLELEARTDSLVGFYGRAGGFTSPNPAWPRRMRRFPATVAPAVR